MDSHWSFNYPDQQLSFVDNTPRFIDQQPQQPHVHSAPSGSGNLLQQQLKGFWESQCQESSQAVDFRNHSLPLARIKKIMKSDDNVRMISADAPVLLSRACEMFIQDLTLRAWSCTEEGKRKTLQKADISAALSTTDLFDFLVDILPREKPLTSTIPPMNVMMNTASSSLGGICNHHHQHLQQHEGYCVGDAAGTGLNKGLQMNQRVDQQHEQVNNGGFDNSKNNIYGGWPNYLSHHSQQSAWPPPDF
ncbi:nuclear transcription factor Y subunit C-4-like [Chenopodium quinoa]|uniref:nuclear transcription factor Y subunit C-4-like n=1 Tax=Chenopodium quinoa TaxID=63459 RepID=UPI000B783169|nr:nuclear transcription factor Y subunit C-4-like [Chenopodium quinoa]